MISRVKGTQDFLDLSLYNFVLNQARKCFERYSFTEIATPILEQTELFKRTLGTETDVVSKEMFLIDTPDKQDSLCLRPEATAAVMRAFLENNIEQTPWKVFIAGPMFRYERPQKGRFRQFHQISLEVIGSDSMAQDALFIAMLERFFHEKLHLDTYALTLNFLGCSADRQAFKKKLDAFLTGIQTSLCAQCIVRKEKNIMRVFDCKNEQCIALYAKAPHIAQNLCTACDVEWNTLKELLDFLSISYTYRPTLVRGLDYYDKTVFEFVSDNLGAQNAFCSGGRYNRLATDIGANKDYPSIGAAMGMERILLLLEPIKEKLALPQLSALHLIMPMESAQFPLALLLADELLAKGLCVDVALEGGSIKSMMRKANSVGAKFALILGSEEQKNRTVTVKNMITGAQEVMPQIAVAEFVQK